MGHTMSIHSQNEQVILEFGLKKPAFRIAVNSPTTFGSIGLTTGLDPAMTLVCGGYGGNITADNISPGHLLNIKRLAYEIVSVPNRFERAAGKAPSAGSALPASPARPAESVGIQAEVLTRRIDQFLGSRGIRPAGVTAPASQAALPDSATPAGAPARPLDFVCEEDVRLALRDGRTLLVSERAIVTPSARELGERHGILTIAPWRG